MQCHSTECIGHCPNKGMVKKGCTLIWQSESTKQTLPKPQKARYDYRD